MRGTGGEEARRRGCGAGRFEAESVQAFKRSSGKRSNAQGARTFQRSNVSTFQRKRGQAWGAVLAAGGVSLYDAHGADAGTPEPCPTCGRRMRSASLRGAGGAFRSGKRKAQSARTLERSNARTLERSGRSNARTFQCLNVSTQARAGVGVCPGGGRRLLVRRTRRGRRHAGAVPYREPLGAVHPQWAAFQRIRRPCECPTCVVHQRISDSDPRRVGMDGRRPRLFASSRPHVLTSSPRRLLASSHLYGSTARSLAKYSMRMQ